MWRRAVEPGKVQQAFERVPLDCPIADGVPLEFTIAGGAGYYQLEHGLGRLPVGVIQSGSSTTDALRGIFNNATYPADERLMYFYVTGNATFRAWVY